MLDRHIPFSVTVSSSASTSLPSLLIINHVHLTVLYMFLKKQSPPLLDFNGTYNPLLLTGCLQRWNKHSVNSFMVDASAIMPVQVAWPALQVVSDQVHVKVPQPISACTDMQGVGTK